MKKIMALAVTALAAISFASAAPILVLHGYLGEGWGTSINGYSSSDTESMPLFDNLYLGGGAGLNFTLDGNIGIQPEVDYRVNNITQQDVSSGTLWGTTTTITTRSCMTYNTIDIPVLLTYRYNKFNLSVGPQISIPLTGVTTTEKTTTVTTSSSNSSTSNSTGTPSTQELSSKVIFGLAGGVEYEERMGSGRLIYGMRYVMDFSPVQYTTTSTDGSGNTTTTTHDLFTRREMEVTIGYKLAL